MGDNDVTKILAYKSDTETVFYEATLLSAPSQLHIFSISNIFKTEAQDPICLTCDQIERNCTFQTALFSPTAEYFALNCLGMGSYSDLYYTLYIDYKNVPVCLFA